MFCLCNCFGISSSLQLLQFGICVQFLQFFLGVIFCLPLLQNLVFRLSFSFCHDIYYQRDCLVTLVPCWYESFFSHPTPMYCDNQSFIQITHNLVFHERTKHIEIVCHLTRHHLKHGTITLPLVPSSMQIADFFTKAHSISRFCFLIGKLSMLVAVASWVWGEMLNNIYLVLFIKGRIVFSV